MERKSRNLAGLRIEFCIRITLVSFSTVASILLAWFMLGGSQHHAQAASPPTIQEIYTPSSNPWGLAFDNSGNVWLAEPECDPTPVCGSVQTGSIAQYSR